MQAQTQNWLMPLCQYVQATSWATAIRTSLWAYPFIQLIHFSGLSVWLGTNIAGDLRLLGVGKKPQTASEVRDELFVWNWIGFSTVVPGGFLLRNELHREPRVSHETIYASSRSTRLACLCPNEDTGLGKDSSNLPCGKVGRVG